MFSDGRSWQAERLLTWIKKARSVYCDVLTTIRNHLDGICNYFWALLNQGMNTARTGTS